LNSGHAQPAPVLDFLPSWILCDRLSCANRVRFRYTQQPTTIFSFSGQPHVLRFRQNPLQHPQAAWTPASHLHVAETRAAETQPDYGFGFEGCGSGRRDELWRRTEGEGQPEQPFPRLESVGMRTRHGFTDYCNLTEVAVHTKGIRSTRGEKPKSAAPKRRSRLLGSVRKASPDRTKMTSSLSVGRRSCRYSQRSCRSGRSPGSMRGERSKAIERRSVSGAKD
jgi:hypothetical protein